MTQSTTQQLGARALAAMRVARRSTSSSQTHTQLTRRTAVVSTVGLDALRTTSTTPSVALPTPLIRTICTTRVTTQRNKAQSSEATEAMLAQQMLDFMAMDDDDNDNNDSNNSNNSELSVTGVVLGVQHGIARISGLRLATIGSVVAIARKHDSDANGADATDNNSPLCRGVVLFLEKKVAHVALIRDRNHTDAMQHVTTGRSVTLESSELTIDASVATFAGRVVDALGHRIDDDVVDSSTTSPSETGSSTDRVPIAWSATTVPGLMQRAPLSLATPLATGVLALDCFHPLVAGYRLGLLGPRNSGKTRVALDVIAHVVTAALALNEPPPSVVYVAIGKTALRVSQIRAFLEAAGALPYVTIVAATDRDARIEQYLAPFTGIAIAEFLRDKSPARHCVMVYDDLAAHTVVVESLVETMKLPRASASSLSAHTVLMERSAALFDDGIGSIPGTGTAPTDRTRTTSPLKRPTKALTTLALADAPDSAAWETSALQQTMRAIVDDAVTLEATLAQQRVFPPIDVLAPGSSIRGPPFQSATCWHFMTQLRLLVNAAAQTKANVDTATKLGFEIEPDDHDVLAVQSLVREFFDQLPLTNVRELHCVLGLCFLTSHHVLGLPRDVKIWDVVRDVVERLATDAPELLHLLDKHPRDVAWPQYAQDEVLRVFATHVTALRLARKSRS